MSHNDNDESSREATASFREKTTYMGRDYQTWSLLHQINLAPVDDDEESRLRLQHALMKEIFSTRKDPLLPDFVQAPENVLDCGFGTGDWAYDLAESLPDCEVVAVDISPIMELGDMPDNLEQEIADLNDPFTFASSSFDFVHSRFVSGGIAHSRWPSYLSDVKRQGNLVVISQMDDPTDGFQSVAESWVGAADRSLREWSDTYLAAISRGVGNSRKSRSVPEVLETMLRASGFSNVSVDVQEIPTCGWSASPSKAALGEQNLQNMESLLSAYALYPVTSRTEMTQADFDDLVSRAKQELRDRSARPYLRLYTYFGQKP